MVSDLDPSDAPPKPKVGDLYQNPATHTLYVYGPIDGGGAWVELEAAEPFASWKKENPRLWWALSHTPNDELRDSLLGYLWNAKTLSQEQSNLLGDEAEQLEDAKTADENGILEDAPVLGERNTWAVIPRRYEALRDKKGRKIARVFFTTENGWGGYFETRNPEDVRVIHNAIGNSVRVSGEIRQRSSHLHVILGGAIRVWGEK